MNNNFLNCLAEIPETKLFLTKNYGLELLFCLEKFGEMNSDNGIDDTFDSVLYYRPRRAAFSKYCSILRSSNSIIYEESKFKKSKRILRLSNKSIKQLLKARKAYIDNL